MHPRQILPGVVLLLLVVAAGVVQATTAVVPDSFPTVQSAIDAADPPRPWCHRDTVLVRSGIYNEHIRVTHGVALLAYPNPYGWLALPEIAGLTLGGTEEEWSCSDPRLRVEGFRIMGKVELRPSIPGVYVHDVAFTTCRIDSGIAIGSDGSYQGTIHIRGCTVLGDVYASTTELSDIILNSVYGGGIHLSADATSTIAGNYVHGPAPCGIYSRSWGQAFVDGNTVVGTDIGINGLGDPSLVTNNVVMDCAGTGILANGTWDHVTGNQVLRCGGYGLYTGGPYGCSLLQNTVVECVSGGIRIKSDEATVERNIAYGNQGPGLLFEEGGVPTPACNDWFANLGGATNGGPPGESDLSVEPCFCDLTNGDLHLSSTSPLLNAAGCGLIGALGQGCGNLSEVPPVTGGQVRGFTVSPNPSHGAVQFSWGGPARPEYVDVFDVTGARRWGSRIESGARLLSWHGTDDLGRQLPAGVYYARLTGKGTSATARFVVIQ